MNYYLINNTIKKGSEMPNVMINHPNYNDIMMTWKKSLQPCEISESELYKIKLYLTRLNNSEDMTFINPIDVTELVDVEYDGHYENIIIKFKTKDKPKQVDEIEAIELHNHKDWDLAYHFYRLGRFEEREGVFQKHFKEYLVIKSEQPKQVDEIKAVEFHKWILENYTLSALRNGYYINPQEINDNYYTVEQLYEIFKNRK